MTRKKKQPYFDIKPGRITSFAGGMNNAIKASMLQDDESVLLQCYSMDEKGTLFPIKGIANRHNVGDLPGALNGMGAYYRSDGISRLVHGVGGSLYVDTPRLVETFDSQAEWETGARQHIDTATTPGSILPDAPYSDEEATEAELAAGTLTDVVATSADNLELSPTENIAMGRTYAASQDLTNTADQAFDGNVATFWRTGNTVADAWVRVDFGAALSPTATRVRLLGGSGNADIRAFTLQGSNDLAAWVDLVSGEYVNDGTWQTWDFVNVVGYRYYRVLVATNYGSTFVRCYEIELMEGSYLAAGNRISPTKDISLAGIAGDSKITWSETLNGQTLTVEAAVFKAGTPVLFETAFADIAVNSFVKGASDAELPLSQKVNATDVLLRVPTGTETWNNQEAAGWTGHWHGGISLADDSYVPAKADADGYDQASVRNIGEGWWTQTARDVSMAYWVNTTGDVTWTAKITVMNIRPALTLVANVFAISGDGTELDPYILTEKEYVAAVNGDPIPGITDGMDLTDYLLETRVSLSTADNTVTPQLHSISVFVYSQSLWVSPTIDVSSASDLASGLVKLESVTPGTSGIIISSRSSPDGATWTGWVNANASGELQHAPDDDIQVRLRLEPDESLLPSVEKATITFDGEPSVVLVAADFTPGGEFFFASLLDYMVVVNGLDVPRKYDGTDLTLVAGDPPRGRFVVAHKNRLWMLLGSRLYFSDLLDIEGWPVLNFIDISPNDGDTGTGLYPVGDYLVITKNRSVWLLTGDSIDNYAVRRMSAVRGNVAPRSLIMVNDLLCFVSSDGIYFSDFTQTVLASERLRKTWDDELNHRRLNQAVAWFANQKLYICLPGIGSRINDVTLVFDAIRQAWYTISGWNISCTTEWSEAGRQITLLGYSDSGQVAELNSGQSNGGDAIEAVWESKHFDHGFPEIEKRYLRTLLNVTPGTQDVDLEIQYIVDGGAPTGAITVTVPARADKRTETIEIDPAAVGVHYARSIAYRILQDTLNAAVGIQSVSQEFYPTKTEPTIRA